VVRAIFVLIGLALIIGVLIFAATNAGVLIITGQ
jgi:hypothetical protein